MEKSEVEELRSRVPCAAVLEQADFALDVKESTRRAVKYRRGDDIIIVIHDGKGWFDPLSEAKGDVFSLIQHVENVSFVEALALAAGLVGFTPREPIWQRPVHNPNPRISPAERWRNRRKPWRGSATWRYLRDERQIPEYVIRRAVACDILREGPHGSMWAAHIDDQGSVTGWEERGPKWRGYATGGGKVLFRFGIPNALRICVTEAAIDAMSIAAIERIRSDTLYLSTGGGWAPATSAALRLLVTRPGACLVAATDANPQGEVFVSRLRELVDEFSCEFERLKPPAEDWNAVLQGEAASA